MRRRVPIVLPVLSVLLLLAGPARAVETWRDANYGFRKAITFDAPGANLTDFPCLVYIDGDDDGTADGGEDIGDQVQADVDDIKFYDGDGNALPYEVEQYGIGDYDGDADDDDLLLVCWVQTDLYAAPAGDQNLIWMYYGHAGAANGEGDPWDASFVGVWHMADNGNQADSTGNGNTLTALGNAPDYQQAGKIGLSCLYDDANNEYLGRADTLGLSAYPLTLSCWFHTDVSQNQTLILFGDTNAEEYIGMWLRDPADTDVIAHVYNKPLGEFGVAKTTVSYATDSSWQHGCAVLASAASRAATLNGGNEGTDATDVTWPANVDNLRLGARSQFGSTDNYLSGGIDEARVSDVARSADWIAFEHANGGGNADYEQTWSAEESKPSGAALPVLLHHYRQQGSH